MSANHGQGRARRCLCVPVGRYRTPGGGKPGFAGFVGFLLHCADGDTGLVAWRDLPPGVFFVSSKIVICLFGKVMN